MTTSRPWVKVPHRVLDEVQSGTEFAAWVVIARHRSWNDPEAEAYPSRHRVHRALGHLGLDPKTVTLATNALQKRGLLSKRHDHRDGRARVFYRLTIPEQGNYEQLDQRVLEWLADRRLSPEDLLWLARWERACGGAGRTTDSAWTMGQRYTASLSTVKRHRKTLTDHGLLVTERREGLSSITRKPPASVLDDLLDGLDDDAVRDAWDAWDAS